MSPAQATERLPVSGRVDAQGRLVAADPPLADLQARAGGRPGEVLAIPQIAALARLAQRLGIAVSRTARAASGDQDLELVVRAQPIGDDVALEISGWTARAPQPASEAPPAERDADFLRAAADWMWETDAALRITALSGGAASAIGRPAATLIGQPLTGLFRLREGGAGAIPILTALAEHRRFDRQSAELVNGVGGEYELSGVPLIDGMGRFVGFRGAAARTAGAQPALGTQAEPSAPSSFGARLDGALRRPLHQIIEQADRLREQPEQALAADYLSYASDIAAAGRHLLALVDDLVDLQAIERADFRPEAEVIDLADIARRAAGLLAVRAAARQVRIDRPQDDERLCATGDFTRVLQILMNLLTNAIRYSPEGGMVWIRTEREADLACVIVADQGKGVAPEDHHRIFEKFERVDPLEPGGTGLGLYIARRLARAMGGDIDIDSGPGMGARFTLTLPVRAG